MGVELKRPSNVAELLQLLTLASVDFYEMSGRVDAGFDPAHESEDGNVQIDVGPALRIRTDGVDVRCRLTARAPGGVIVVDGAAFYNSSEPIEVPHEMAVEFADNVGIMALIPYLRQGVDDLSMRLLFPSRVILPVLLRDAITFGHLDPDQTTSRGAGDESTSPPEG
jgi:hypothetical protein